MLFYETIEPATLAVLKRLMASPIMTGFNLVGGTALALQIGHRLSIDLDLFGNVQFDPDILYGDMTQIGKTNPNFKSPGFLGLFLDEVKVDVVRYPYSNLKPILEIDGIRMLSVEDIAAMKLSAIAKRGSKKNFWDLYFLLQKYSIKEILGFHQKKYGEGGAFMVVKSLTWFEDAEQFPDPVKVIEINWEEIKRTILKEVNGVFGQ